MIPPTRPNPSARIGPKQGAEPILSPTDMLIELHKGTTNGSDLAQVLNKCVIHYQPQMAPEDQNKLRNIIIEFLLKVPQMNLADAIHAGNSIHRTITCADKFGDGVIFLDGYIEPMFVLPDAN